MKNNPATIRFTVRGFAKPKGSTSSFYSKRQKKVFTTSACKGLKSWAENMNYLAQVNAPAVPWDGPVILFLCFNIKKPKSLPKTRRSYAIKNPDLDKLIRAVKDSLTGVIYNDDSQVIHVSSWKDYSLTPGVDLFMINLSAFISQFKDVKEGQKELNILLLEEYVKSVSKVFKLSYDFAGAKDKGKQTLFL